VSAHVFSASQVQPIRPQVEHREHVSSAVQAEHQVDPALPSVLYARSELFKISLELMNLPSATKGSISLIEAPTTVQHAYHAPPPAPSHLQAAAARLHALSRSARLESLPYQVQHQHVKLTVLPASAAPEKRLSHALQDHGQQTMIPLISPALALRVEQVGLELKVEAAQQLTVNNVPGPHTHLMPSLALAFRAALATLQSVQAASTLASAFQTRCALMPPL
jgi:hypothetical protein